MVMEALRRDSPDWELKNCCPACMYTIQDEPPLLFKMLYAMDGNDSLKRVSHTLFTQDGHHDSLGRSNELPTGQHVQTDRYYLPRTYVESFSDKGTSHHPKLEVSAITWTHSFSLIIYKDMEDNPCLGRWKNMDDKKTQQSWGIYDENGVFLAVCRHGFVLLIADIVQSGEL